MYNKNEKRKAVLDENSALFGAQSKAESLDFCEYYMLL